MVDSGALGLAVESRDDRVIAVLEDVDRDDADSAEAVEGDGTEFCKAEAVAVAVFVDCRGDDVLDTVCARVSVWAVCDEPDVCLAAEGAAEGDVIVMATEGAADAAQDDVAVERVADGDEGDACLDDVLSSVGDAEIGASKGNVEEAAPEDVGARAGDEETPESTRDDFKTRDDACDDGVALAADGDSMSFPGPRLLLLRR